MVRLGFDGLVFGGCKRRKNQAASAAADSTPRF
jgi:hypothetical protein